MRLHVHVYTKYTYLICASGLLYPGDIIHEINGKDIKGFTVDDVADLMVNFSQQ